MMVLSAETRGCGACRGAVPTPRVVRLGIVSVTRSSALEGLNEDGICVGETSSCPMHVQQGGAGRGVGWSVPHVSHVWGRTRLAWRRAVRQSVENLGRTAGGL